MVRDGVSHLGAVLIGYEGNIQLSVGGADPKGGCVGWGYMGTMGGHKSVGVLEGGGWNTAAGGAGWRIFRAWWRGWRWY